jgi:hypothetical protein
MSGCKRAYVDTIFLAFRCKVPDRFSKYPRPMSATTSATVTSIHNNVHGRDTDIHDNSFHGTRMVRLSLPRTLRAPPHAGRGRGVSQRSQGSHPSRSRHVDRTLAYSHGCWPPWERELFGYAHAIRRLNEQLESKRMRAVRERSTLATTSERR